MGTLGMPTQVILSGNVPATRVGTLNSGTIVNKLHMPPQVLCTLEALFHTIWEVTFIKIATFRSAITVHGPET
jgi:hypothetical protein